MKCPHVQAWFFYARTGSGLLASQSSSPCHRKSGLKLVGPKDFDEYVNVTFGTDRMGIPKATQRGVDVSLRNEQELISTRSKLARLDEHFESLRAETSGDEELRDMTLESLRRTINQFKEEIARYTSNQTSER